MITTLFLSTIVMMIAVVAVLAILAVIHLVFIAVSYARHVYRKTTKRE
jgi:Tfp pilus assembly protein PilE